MGDLGSISGLGRSPGEYQYSCLENSMDCIVHGITKSWTRLSDFHFHVRLCINCSELRDTGIKITKIGSCLEVHCFEIIQFHCGEHGFDSWSGN